MAVLPALMTQGGAGWTSLVKINDEATITNAFWD
jgi:hypothetical protein